MIIATAIRYVDTSGAAARMRRYQARKRAVETAIDEVFAGRHSPRGEPIRQRSMSRKQITNLVHKAITNYTKGSK